MFSCSACRLSSAPLVSFSCTPTCRSLAVSRPARYATARKANRLTKMIACSAFSPGCVRAIGRNHAVIVQFQNRAVKNECQRRDQVRPHSRQEHAGHNDDQRIKEIQRTVPAPGFMHDQADENQIGENLQRGLQPVFLPEREQEHVEQRKAVPEKNRADEEPHGQRRRS